MATTIPVPAGWRLTSDPDTGWLDPATLVGGAPWRVLRLGERGARLVAAWYAGEPVGSGRDERLLARRLLDAGLAHPLVQPRPRSDVTVVVPVRDDPVGLRAALAAVRSADPAVPLVVVDDGSRDPEAVEHACGTHGAELVRHHTARGPAAARNAGRGRVRTPLVAFCDADVVGRYAWWGHLAGHLADPAVALAAPRVRSRPGPGRLAAYERRHSPLDLGPRPGPVAPGRPVAYVPAAAVVVRVDALDEVGGFDEDLRYGEDVDLVWRLVAAGHTVRYDPTVGVVHRPRGSWGAWFHQRRRYGTSAAALARRHGRAVAPLRASPWSLAVWAPALLGHRRAAAAVALASTAALAVRLRELPRAGALAASVTGRGHLLVGRGLARATRRTWWPLLVPLARRRRVRRWLLAAFVLDPLLENASGRAPVSDLAIGIADDVAYSLGVWEAVVTGREPGPLVPDLGGRRWDSGARTGSR